MDGHVDSSKNVLYIVSTCTHKLIRAHLTRSELVVYTNVYTIITRLTAQSFIRSREAACLCVCVHTQ